MSNQNFIDHVIMYCRSGDGGAGSSHLHRAKFIPKGGPDGGDGGRGGHVIMKATSQRWTLIHLRYKKHAKAKDGEPGGVNNRTGKDGADIILEVPLGTVAKDRDTGEIIGEVTENEQEIILLPGGKGGLGNTHFKTSTRQTPRYAQPGLPGIEKSITLELKLLADVGLVGFPNAGKSTLLASVSAARPKIASYEFTTLVPNLGVVEYREGLSFVMADIPGIIEKAHEGKGLGTRFLRHIERNAILLFVISCEEDDLGEAYQKLLKECLHYNKELGHKPHVIAVSKSDLIDEELMELMKPQLPANVPFVFISAVSQYGLTELKDVLWNILSK